MVSMGMAESGSPRNGVSGLEWDSNDDYIQAEIAHAKGRLLAAIDAQESEGAGARRDHDVMLQEGPHSVWRTAARSMRRSLARRGMVLPVEGIAGKVGLDEVDEEILFTCLAVQLLPELRPYLARLRRNVLLDYLDVGTLVTLLAEGADDTIRLRGRLGATAPLARSGLVRVEERTSEGARSLLQRKVEIPESVVELLLGSPLGNVRLNGWATLYTSTTRLHQVILPEVTRARLVSFVKGCASSTTSCHGQPLHQRMTAPEVVVPSVPASSSLTSRSTGMVFMIAGPPGTGRTMVAEGIASELGRPVAALDGARLVGEVTALRGSESIAETLAVAALHDAVVLLDEGAVLADASPATLSLLAELLGRYQGLVVIITGADGELPHDLDGLVMEAIHLVRPSHVEREQLWESHLPPSVPLADDISVSSLASSYDLTGAQISHAVTVAKGLAKARGGGAWVVTMGDLVEGARRQLRSKLGRFASRREASLSLDDLVLPAEEKAMVHEIIDACRHKSGVLNDWGFGRKLVTGKGLVILFSGEPGTGKTLCAEIMARELGLDLHVVDTHQIVSKWVGETEKNIAEVFSHARATSSMLLFDEADSLFATRVGTVESTMDRMSNMETNVLLQEIERFDGVVVLTTNMEGSIDKAFGRRIQFRLGFPFPEAAERSLIWRRLIPDEAPLASDVDFEVLGRSFELAGGHIKNAILKAAYRSHAMGASISMGAIAAAAEQECKAAGKLFRLEPAAGGGPVRREAPVRRELPPKPRIIRR